MQRLVNWLEKHAAPDGKPDDIIIAMIATGLAWIITMALGFIAGR